jgi:hypothetical protein
MEGINFVTLETRPLLQRPFQSEGRVTCDLEVNGLKSLLVEGIILTREISEVENVFELHDTFAGLTKKNILNTKNASPCLIEPYHNSGTGK